MVQSRLWRHRGRRELEAALVAGGRPKLFIIDYYHSDFHSGQDNHRLSKCQLVLTDDGAAGPGGTTSDPTAVAFACAFRHIVMISSAFGFARRAGACACLEAAAVLLPGRPAGMFQSLGALGAPSRRTSHAPERAIAAQARAGSAGWRPGWALSSSVPVRKAQPCTHPADRPAARQDHIIASNHG